MANASTSPNNTTERYIYTYVDRLKFGLSLIPVLLFVYINCAMLVTLNKKADFRGVSRYILFGHMLVADSVQMLWSMFAYLIASVKMYMSNGLCLIFLLVADIVTRISPLNLAVMSLERYSAICFPLRHAEIATSKSTGIAIGVVWVMGSLNALVECFLLVITGPPLFVTQPYCFRATLFTMKVYFDMSKVFTAVYFVSVGLIIIYTYVAIMFEARSVTSDKGKAKKARSTVLLHFIQLGLCLCSFAVVIINALAVRLGGNASANVQYISFILLVILPRFLSPLIYGLRDESFRPFFVYYFTFGFKNKIKPAVS